jgi:predicted house-cleaning noncanonical NTP pyrophosphatase (MazG superfamily)
MKPVTESVFVQALKDLANTLRQREDEGLNRFIEPDDPTLLREIAENLNDGNVEEMCTKCTEVISTLGEVRGGRMADNLESLQAITYHLGTIRQNPLRSDGDTHTKLDRVLAEKIELFKQKAEAFEAYIR